MTADPIGARIGHFRVESKLGQGGMGVVYKATDEELRRTVAVKVLPPALIDDGDRRARFLREARAAAAVTHPNLVTIYEVGEDAGRVFLAMEYIAGKSLRRELESGAMPWKEAVRIAHGIARGVSKAHEAGIVHRDLKPDNVMLTEERDVKVLDFGLAKLRETEEPASGSPSLMERAETALNVTEKGVVMGTPGYMSPEQATGKAVDARSDVFSIGVILYELLTGKRPFLGETTMEVIVAISRDEHAPVSSMNAAVPANLDAIVARCLAKAPAARYASARELAVDLDVASADRAHLRSIAPAASPRPKRGLAVAAIVGALALAGGFAMWRTRSTPADGAAATSASTPAASGSASSLAAPKPTAITDLELPPSKVPDALAAYRAALQSLRDASWGLAATSVERAIALDPSMASAHLRGALLQKYLNRALPPTEIHRRYMQAVQLRGSLNERDRLLLEALEPLLSREPSDISETARRLQAAVARFPGDAELAALTAFLAQNVLGPEKASVYNEKAVAIDPLYADAWQSLANQSAELGRYDEAKRGVARCLAIVPMATDCFYERAFLDETEGNCEAFEADLRAILAINPQGALHLGERPSALYLLGKPRETVREALEQKWAQIPEAERKAAQLLDEGRLQVLQGAFDVAARTLVDADTALAGDANSMSHAEPLALLVEVDAEMGRTGDAARVAGGYLKRRELWTAASSAWNDVTPLMLSTELRGGLLDPAVHEAEHARWTQTWRAQTPPFMLWAAAYMGVESVEEGRPASAALGATPIGSAFYRRPILAANAGKALLMAGKPAEARPLLEQAAKNCRVQLAPIKLTRAHFFLGQALEATGDPKGACAAYRVVLDRWGKAKPKSVTADRARERAKALDCK